MREFKRSERKKHRGLAALCRCMLAALVCASHGSAQTELTISAAASLKDALAEEETTYKQSHANVDFENNFGSSGTLATQIDQGAPVDIFLSAAAKPMDDLEAKGLIVAGTRRNLLKNSLVLIVPLDSQLKDFQGLASSGIRVIALGDPAACRLVSMDSKHSPSFICWTISRQNLCLARMCARF